MDSSYERLQGSADYVSKAMLELTTHLDTNNAKLDDKAKRLASVFDRETLIFLRYCNQYNTVSAVKWNGRITPLMGLIMSLKGFMEHAKQVMGYKFNSLEWFEN